jgi:hypothetical protein
MMGAMSALNVGAAAACAETVAVVRDPTPKASPAQASANVAVVTRELNRRMPGSLKWLPQPKLGPYNA